jgi:hypothetical protein
MEVKEPQSRIEGNVTTATDAGMIRLRMHKRLNQAKPLGVSPGHFFTLSASMI